MDIYMYYYVLRVTATIATMYMVNFVNKLQKSEEKGHTLSAVPFLQYVSQIDTFGMYM